MNGEFYCFEKELGVTLEEADVGHNYGVVTINKVNGSDPQTICRQLQAPKSSFPYHHHQTLYMVIRAVGSIGSTNTSLPFCYCPSTRTRCAN